MEQVAAPDMLDALAFFVGSGVVSLYVPLPVIVMVVGPYLMLMSLTI